MGCIVVHGIIFKKSTDRSNILIHSVKESQEFQTCVVYVHSDY